MATLAVAMLTLLCLFREAMKGIRGDLQQEGFPDCSRDLSPLLRIQAYLDDFRGKSIMRMKMEPD